MEHTSKENWLPVAAGAGVAIGLCTIDDLGAWENEGGKMNVNYLGGYAQIRQRPAASQR